MNFAGGIKRFLTNKNTITIIGVIAGILVLWFFYQMRVNDAIAPINVPYAKEQIGATHEIVKENIDYVEINRAILDTIDIIQTENDLVGKYVTTGTSIPAGGFFYTSQIIEKEDLPNAVFDDIPEGYTLFSLDVNIDSTYGNSIYPGDKIDLYIKANDDIQDKIMFGKFVESIEVLAVRDSGQNDVFESTETGTSALLLFAVEDEMFHLLTQATFVSGLEIIPVPRNKEYTTDAGTTEVKSEYIRQFILSKTVTVSE